MTGEQGGRRWRYGLLLVAGSAAALVLTGLALAGNPTPSVGAATFSEPPLGTGPPRRILLQSFQI